MLKKNYLLDVWKLISSQVRRYTGPSGRQAGPFKRSGLSGVAALFAPRVSWSTGEATALRGDVEEDGGAEWLH